MAKKRDKKEQEKKKKKNGRMPCCEKEGIRRGAWTAQEDKILTNFITQNGHGTWRNLPKLAGLPRCGKSCRLRWTNYLRPDIKRGPFTPDEENSIVHLHQTLGNKWSAIASHLPGRTDNDVKNFWNSHLRKRLSCKVQNQTPSSSMSDDTKCEYPLTAQTVNTESHINTPSGSKGEGDYFLRLWNCEVGQSFRNNNEIEWDAAVSHSPASQTSYFTNIVEPFKADQNVEFLDCKKESENVGVYSDSSKSCDLDDSSEAMLELLLDFPAGTDDIEFVQGPVDDVSTDIRG